MAPEVAEKRIAAAVAAGGTVVDDSDAPSLTVIADQDGNKGVGCVDVSAATKGVTARSVMRRCLGRRRLDAEMTHARTAATPVEASADLSGFGRRL